MSIFPELTNAEIAVKQIMLNALEEKQKEVEPFMVHLRVEIDDLKRDIQRLQEK